MGSVWGIHKDKSTQRKTRENSAACDVLTTA